MAGLMAIDIETYSDVSLPDCGVHRYVSSPQFEILLFAYSIDDGEIAVVDFASGEEMPETVMEYLKDDTVIKTAFNASFERTCINRYFHLDLQPESWRCTAVQASMREIQMYYVEDDHDAIISKRIWECVQLEIKRREKYLEEHGTNSYSHRA